MHVVHVVIYFAIMLLFIADDGVHIISHHFHYMLFAYYIIIKPIKVYLISLSLFPTPLLYTPVV